MEQFKALETSRLIIRQFTQADSDDFTRFMTDASITDNLAFDDALKSREGALAILGQTLDSYNTDQPLLAFAISDKGNGVFMGACGINLFEEVKAEVFYALFPAFWGRGFATEVLAALKDYLLQSPRVKEIHAYIKPGNIASIRIVEKFGFANFGLVNKEGFEDKVFDYVLEIE